MTETVLVPVEDQDIRDKLIVTMEGNDFQKDLEYFAITMEMSDDLIMEAIAPYINEQFGVNIARTYKIKKALNTNNIYVIPNSTAG